MKRKIFLLAVITIIFTTCEYPFSNYYLPQEPEGDVYKIEPAGGAKIGELLTAYYTGHEPVTFQWYKDDVAIPGATGNTFTPIDPGSYTVGIKLPGGGDEKISYPPIVITTTAPPPPPTPLPAPGLYLGAPDTINASSTPITSVAANNITAAVAYVNLNTGDGEFTLLINTNTNAANLTLNAGAKMTIASFGSGIRTIQHNGGADERMFNITGAGASLTIIDNITLQGRSGGSSTFLLQLTSGGTLIMEGTSKITGHNTSDEGAIFVGNGSELVMKGGEISGNSTSHAEMHAPGGVYNMGTITMNGGKIINNSTAHGRNVDALITWGRMISLSDDAEIGSLILLVRATGSPVQFCTINIPGAYTGSVSAIHLHADSDNIANTSRWINMQFVLGGGSSDAISGNKLILGRFGSSIEIGNNINVTHQISGSGFLVAN